MEVKFLRFFLLLLFYLLFVFCVLLFLEFFHGADNNSVSSSLSCVQKDGICQISSSNYTNILKTVHDDIDSYIGVKIHFSGYVYRLLDFSDSQFVLARNMVISSDFQTVVVGFLCEHEGAKNFDDNTWVELTGEIVKGDYHGNMPIVKVISINKCEKPNEEFVYPPDESYIPTSGIV